MPHLDGCDCCCCYDHHGVGGFGAGGREAAGFCGLGERRCLCDGGRYVTGCSCSFGVSSVVPPPAP